MTALELIQKHDILSVLLYDKAYSVTVKLRKTIHGKRIHD